MTMKTLGDITRYQREKRPDSVAIIDPAGNREWSFRDLDDESCRVAHALKEMGVGPQDRVAYLDKNLPEYFSFLFGSAKLNAVTVAINWRLAAGEIEYILTHSQAMVLLIGEALVPLLDQMKLNFDNVIVLGDPGSSTYPSYTQWIQSQPDSDLVCPANPQDTCMQLYTSGTTGFPKGVETTHLNMISMLEHSVEALDFSDAAVSLVCMPLFHIAGTAWGLIGLFDGATGVLLKEPDMQEILRVIPAHKITHTLFVPAVLQFLLAQPNVGEVDFGSLQAIVYGASPITESVLVKSIETFDADFHGVYGLTETSGGITRLSPSDHDPGGPRSRFLHSCGKAANGHEVMIVDTESGAEVSPGKAGEIWVRGPQVMRGYWQDPEATRAVIDEDGWFKTGDVGYIDEGYIFIHDRIKDMIISGAENIYPSEVENALMRHPGIADVAVIGVPDENWGEAVKAIVCRSDLKLSEADVINYCRDQIAHFKCPRSIEWIETLPRNQSGKVLKTKLREAYGQPQDSKSVEQDLETV